MILSATSKLLGIIAMLFLTIQGFAQETETSGSTSASTSEVSSTTTETTWYMQPWAWVVGGVVLLLIIILLARGGRGNSDSVTVRKTVTHD